MKKKTQNQEADPKAMCRQDLDLLQSTLNSSEGNSRGHFIQAPLRDPRGPRLSAPRSLEPAAIQQLRGHSGLTTDLHQLSGHLL